MEVVEDNGGELAECVGTRCKQQDSLIQERGEGLCPLEAGRDEESPVEPCEVEGASAVDGTLVVARFPSVSVPVCVVLRCMYTSVAKCVLQTHA